MAALHRINPDPIHKLLKDVSFHSVDRLDNLLRELAPVFEVDLQTEGNLFQAALGEPNIIRFGLKCTIRLQAHAYATAVMLDVFEKFGLETINEEQIETSAAPADQLVKWATDLDLQRWLAQQGADVRPEQFLPDGLADLPEELLAPLTEQQRLLGRGLFRDASAFILLHELAHLKMGHTESTFDAEKAADLFAAEWMSEAASGVVDDSVEDKRLRVLVGIGVALLWLTLFNVYLGPSNSKTHPEGYNRLFQVLDHIIDSNSEAENRGVWFVVLMTMLAHMWSAGFDLDDSFLPDFKQGNHKDKVNDLIDRIANGDRKR